LTTLESACEETVGQLKAALIRLYDDIGSDPARPQDVSRELHLGKTLAWNCTKLMQSSDALSAVPHVPGSASIERVLKASQSRGASSHAIERVRQAARAFERMIEEHVGDRATLDLVVDGLGTTNAGGLELSRKRAFHGHSGIYGVQAKTQAVCCFLAPNREHPDSLDMAMVRGLVSLRRLREEVRLPILRIRHWSDGGQAIGTLPWQPIEPGAKDFVLSRFSHGNVPQIDAVDAERGKDFVLRPGPIGNHGAFDFFLGDMLCRAASRYRTEQDSEGVFGALVTVPTEQLVFDLIYHRELSFVRDADTHVFAFPVLNTVGVEQHDDSMRLPIQQPAMPLAGSPPAVSTPRLPGYAELVRDVIGRLGGEPDQFGGLRFELRFPPLGSTAMLSFALPERRDGPEQ